MKFLIVFIGFAATTTISSIVGQNFDQFGISGSAYLPGQATLYPFLQQAPPLLGGPPHGPGPHGPGHVHVPHPESPLDMFRQTPRHGELGGPGGPGGIRGRPAPTGPYATGLRLPAGFQYPMGPQFQMPPPPRFPAGGYNPQTTSTVECSCSVSFGIQNTSALILPRTPQSAFPGIICGPGSVSLCRIQCLAQALNSSFDLLNQAVNPFNGSGVSLQQFICGNQTATTDQQGSTISQDTNSRLVNIKFETSCSEQSNDYSATNRRSESMALGPQECDSITSIGSFQLPTMTPSTVPPAA